jgi:hypothetical protein
MAKKPKKISNSRPARWGRAVKAAKDAIDAVEVALANLNAAREELAEIQQEYSDWKDNLPENLSQSALGDKLETVCGIDLESEATLEGTDWVDEAGGADLPLGFGKD